MMVRDRLRTVAVSLALSLLVPAIIGVSLFVWSRWARAHFLASPAFADVTDEAHVSYSDDTYGLAWGDYDGDGYLDLLAGNHLNAPSLYRNNGDGTFTDTLDGTGIGPQGDRKDNVWVDYDNDGDLDLYITLGLGDRGPSQLYRNDGSGNFVNVAGVAGVMEAGGRGRGAAWADYDNDGDLDLFVANAYYVNAPNVFFRNNGDGTFTEVGAEVNLAEVIGSIGAAWADYDHDGDPDLYVTGVNNRLYRNDGAVFTDVTDAAGVQGSDGAAAAWADYDEDGNLDLYVSSGTGMGVEDYQTWASNVITFVGCISSGGDEDGLNFVTPAGISVTFHLQEFKKDAIQDESIIFLGPDGHHPAENPFTLGGETSDPPPYTPAQDEGFFVWQSLPGGWHIRWSAPELAIENVHFTGLITASAPISGVAEIGFEYPPPSSLPDRLFRNIGDGTFVDVTEAAGLSFDGDSRGAAWGDYDNDGDLDLFLVLAGGVRGNEPDRLYRNNGDGTFTDVAVSEEVTGSAGGRGWSAMWADYDNDGFLDLYVSHRGLVWPLTPGGHQLFHNQGNSNHWLKLYLIGEVSNRDSLGAKVWVTAGGRTRFREYADGALHYAHYNGPLHVGLGANTVADEVRVEWPSGITRMLTDVPADQHLVIHEGGPLSIAMGAEPDVVSVGETLVYTLSVTNVENWAAVNVQLTDTLPLPQRAVGVATTRGSCVAGAGWGGKATCDLGTMAPGDSARITLTARVTTTLPVQLPWEMRNTARAVAAGTGGNVAYMDTMLQDCHVRLNDSPIEYGTVQAAVDDSTQLDDVVKVAGYCAGVQMRAEGLQVVYVDRTVTIQGGYSLDNWHTPDPMANPTTVDAWGQGRVFYVTGDVSPTIQGLRITGGDATGLGGGREGEDVGGGVYMISATATISDSWIFGNIAELGGGLFLRDSAAILRGSTVSDNVALTHGGGVFLEESDAVLGGNLIMGNASGKHGSGLYLHDGSDARLVNDVIADNRAGFEGSGVYILDSSPIMVHITIARNAGDGGSGIYVDEGSVGGPNVVTLINTILVSHTVGIYVDVGNTATLTATLWGSGVWSNDKPWLGAGVISISQFNYWGDPAFVAPDAGDYHIGLGSAAIDAGVDVGVKADFDGHPRPAGLLPDIGADELLLDHYLPLMTRGCCLDYYLPLIARDFRYF